MSGVALKRRGVHPNLILGTVVVAICAAVAFGSLKGSTTSSARFDEVVSKTTDRCEVYGILDDTTIRPLKNGNLVLFDLVEEKTGRRLKVLYDNPSVTLPPNFPAASHARAAGTYDPVKKQFVSDSVLTKCPSKYDAGSLELAKKEKVDKWQALTGLKSEGT